MTTFTKTMLILVLCTPLLVTDRSQAAVLTDDEMSLIAGGGSAKGLCGYLDNNHPCLDTVEDVTDKLAGDSCWLCLGGHSVQVSCRRGGPPKSLCQAHAVSNWCGSRYMSIVAMDPHTMERFCPPPSPLGLPGDGCSGMGDPTDWCP